VFHGLLLLWDRLGFVSPTLLLVCLVETLSSSAALLALLVQTLLLQPVLLLLLV
jgi:hypothetical protein